MNGVTSSTALAYVMSSPNDDAASTLVRPCRSLKWPHQPVVMALRTPIVVIMAVCNRAAPACTAGSVAQTVEGSRTGGVDRCVGGTSGNNIGNG